MMIGGQFQHTGRLGSCRHGLIDTIDDFAVRHGGNAPVFVFADFWRHSTQRHRMRRGPGGNAGGPARCGAVCHFELRGQR